MSEVKRYNPEMSLILYPRGAGMREDSAGGYVSYEDYRSLLAEYHALNRCPVCCPQPDDKEVQ